MNNQKIQWAVDSWNKLSHEEGDMRNTTVNQAPQLLTAHPCCPDGAKAQVSGVVIGKIADTAIYQPSEAPLALCTARKSKL